MDFAYNIADVYQKIATIEQSCNEALENRGVIAGIPTLPLRDIEVREIKLHPAKKGFSFKEGQARMLHDLASIELQAMELCQRALVEYPDAPIEFREELSRITISEAEHLRLCLDSITDLGYRWGDWPVHCALWTAVSENDSLLDRILIVHRYLEASGLDAGNHLLRRLESIDAKNVKSVVRQINDEEVGHVEFGSRWYRQICHFQKLDPEVDFQQRMWKLRSQLPKRIEHINLELRKRAGFTDSELNVAQSIREDFLKPRSF